MRVKNKAARQQWINDARKTDDPELIRSYLVHAERWADAIEAAQPVEDEFGAVALAAHRQTVGRFSTFDFHHGPCDLLVAYLDETWELGGHLKRWYEKLERLPG
ncbi:MAG TPA: hypothetical protein VFZ48_03705 [Candidatus Saccharimonadales bacterium]